ncbi:hypothetical protein [Psychrobacillus sp. OK032]|uniref:AMP-binding enzyme n=1 Tax=Psychrobacillus sp. OK032 TaxID=1884358 RepID=UPI00210099E4|nr:hypothetical protein [Psychrobacillus sp. OK032]
MVGETDPTIYGERVKAFIVGPNFNVDDFTELKQHYLNFLAKFKVPEKIEVLENLPRNTSGKILKYIKNNKGKMKCLKSYHLMQNN